MYEVYPIYFVYKIVILVKKESAFDFIKLQDINNAKIL